MVVGTAQRTEQYLHARKEQQMELQESLLDIPACCQKAHQQWKQAGYSDPTWQVMTGDTMTREVDLSCAPAMNILLKPLGIELPGYLPCRPSCEATVHRSLALLELGRRVAALEEMNWLEEMLNWPAEWSALHGIAELKTGIVKLAYASDFTGSKHTIRYHGTVLASDAARGLSFAYRHPQSRSRALMVRKLAERTPAPASQEPRTR